MVGMPASRTAGHSTPVFGSSNPASEASSTGASAHLSGTSPMPVFGIPPNLRTENTAPGQHNATVGGFGGTFAGQANPFGAGFAPPQSAFGAVATPASIACVPGFGTVPFLLSATPLFTAVSVPAYPAAIVPAFGANTLTHGATPASTATRSHSGGGTGGGIDAAGAANTFGQIGASTMPLLSASLTPTLATGIAPCGTPCRKWCMLCLQKASRGGTGGGIDAAGAATTLGQIGAFTMPSLSASPTPALATGTLEHLHHIREKKTEIPSQGPRPISRTITNAVVPPDNRAPQPRKEASTTLQDPLPQPEDDLILEEDNFNFFVSKEGEKKERRRHRLAAVVH